MGSISALEEEIRPEVASADLEAKDAMPTEAGCEEVEIGRMAQAETEEREGETAGEEGEASRGKSAP